MISAASQRRERGAREPVMEKIHSKDATTIVFDQLGEGSAMIAVGGAACDRGANAPIAEALAQHFTVLNYDRRGRSSFVGSSPTASGWPSRRRDGHPDAEDTRPLQRAVVGLGLPATGSYP
jgi:hypothetical protein